MGNVCNNAVLRSNRGCFSIFIKLLPIQPLGREDPLEKEMATHSGTLAGKIPWMEKPVGYSLW